MSSIISGSDVSGGTSGSAVALIAASAVGSGGTIADSVSLAGAGLAGTLLGSIFAVASSISDSTVASSGLAPQEFWHSSALF